MLALRTALSGGGLPTFGPEAISVASSFHHGALYYDLLLPAAWLGNGDPTWVVAEIALLSLLVVPIVWWIARSIAGPGGRPDGRPAGGDLGQPDRLRHVHLEPDAGGAGGGRRLPWRVAGPAHASAAWWVVSAPGPRWPCRPTCRRPSSSCRWRPLPADLRRGPAPRRAASRPGDWPACRCSRSRICRSSSTSWATTSPRRGACWPTSATRTRPRQPARCCGCLRRDPDTGLAADPLADGRSQSALPVAFLTASAITSAWSGAWRHVGCERERRSLRTSRGRNEAGTPRPRRPAQAERAAGRAPSSIERSAYRRAVLAAPHPGPRAGPPAVAQVQELPTEQYHAVADPLVFVAAGLVLAACGGRAGATWRACGRGRASWSCLAAPGTSATGRR